MEITMQDGFTGAQGGFLDMMRSDAGDVTPVATEAQPHFIQDDPVQPEPTRQAPQPVAEDDTPEPVMKKPGDIKKGIDSLLGDEPEAPTKADDSAEDESDLPADATTPEAKGAWKNVKKENRELKQERERLAKELEAAKKIKDSDPIKTEAEELRKERDALRERLVKYDFREDPQYVREIGQPLEHERTAIAKLAKTADIDFAVIEDAIYQSDETKFMDKLDAAIESLTPARQAMVTQSAIRMRNLELRALEMETKAGELLKISTEEKKQMSEKQRTEARAAEMRAVADLEPVLKKVATSFALDGEDADSAVKAILEDAQKTPFEELSPKDKAFGIAAAAMVPRMKERIQFLEATLARKDRAIAKYTGQFPKTNSGSTPPPPKSGNEPVTSFSESFFGKKVNEF
jgi:hypothetical protein